MKILYLLITLLVIFSAVAVITHTIRINRNLKTKNPFHEKTYPIWLWGLISILVSIVSIIVFLFIYVPWFNAVAESAQDLSPSIRAGGIKIILVDLLVGFVIFISSMVCFLLTEKHKSRRKLEWDDLEK